MPPKRKLKLALGKPAMKRLKTGSGAAASACWQYMDGSSWIKYKDEDSALLEAAYTVEASRSKMFSTKSLSFNKGYDTEYKFDFKAMTQVNQDTGKSRTVRRLMIGSADGDAVWEWLDDAGLWVPFYADDNSLIESSFKAGDGNLTTKSLTFNVGFDTTYVFDFKKMTQVNQDSRRARTLRRNTSGSGEDKWDVKDYGVKGKAAPKPEASVSGGGASILDVPSHWSAPKNPSLDLVSVSKDSTEWKSVLADFEKTLGRKPVISKVTRIQNYKLWPFFALKKASMDAKHKDKKGAGVKDANQMMLFHGARQRKNMDAITNFGFDLRVANSGLYGIGIYFAHKASYSDAGYVLMNKDKTKEMFICRVLVGRCVQGKGGLRRPPPVDSKKPTGELYDSVFGGPAKDPIMRIVFDNGMAYPEYIVHYK